MTRVLALGVFDVLHPGHVRYLEEAAAMGGELHVLVLRGEDATPEDEPVVPDRQRRDVVTALDAVDAARLVGVEDAFDRVRAVDPDVVALAGDARRDDGSIAAALAEEGVDCEVARVAPGDPRWVDEARSGGRFVDRVCERRS